MQRGSLNYAEKKKENEADGGWSTVMHRQRASSYMTDMQLADNQAAKTGKQTKNRRASRGEGGGPSVGDGGRKWAAPKDRPEIKAKYGPEGNHSLERSTPALVQMEKRMIYEAKLSLCLNTTTNDSDENVKVRTILEQLSQPTQTVVGKEYQLVAMAALADMLERGAGGPPDHDEALRLTKSAIDEGLEDLAYGGPTWGGKPGDPGSWMPSSSKKTSAVSGTSLQDLEAGIDDDDDDTPRIYPGGHARAQYRLGWLYFQGCVLVDVFVPVYLSFLDTCLSLGAYCYPMSSGWYWKIRRAMKLIQMTILKYMYTCGQ